MSNQPQNLNAVMNQLEAEEEGTEGYDCDAVPQAYRTRYWFYLSDNGFNTEKVMTGRQFVLFLKEYERARI
jgi:hypothetical protein